MSPTIVNTASSASRWRRWQTWPGWARILGWTAGMFIVLALFIWLLWWAAMAVFYPNTAADGGAPPKPSEFSQLTQAIKENTDAQRQAKQDFSEVNKKLDLVLNQVRNIKVEANTSVAIPKQKDFADLLAAGNRAGSGPPPAKRRPIVVR